jgi:regulator of protease activity HflC (stomatin/prohibitin superfamily)
MAATCHARLLTAGAMPDSPDMRSAPRPPAGGVAEAMNRVLEAERAALAELRECQAEAARTLEAARREARAILERAERIARDIHGRTERLAAARARRLVEEAEQRQAERDPTDVLAAAATRLAGKMTGEGRA